LWLHGRGLSYLNKAILKNFKKYFHGVYFFKDFFKSLIHIKKISSKKICNFFKFLTIKIIKWMKSWNSLQV